MAASDALISLGFGGGQIIGQEADDAARMSLLNQIKTMGEIAQQPDEGALKQAHARYYAAQAKEKEQELEMQARLAAAFRNRFGNQLSSTVGVDETGGVTMSSMPLAMSQLAMEAGAPKQAGDWLKQASTIATQEAAREASAARAKKDALIAQKERLSIGAGLLNGVSDQTTADEAERKYQQMTGQSLFEGRKWSPALQDFMRNSALSAKEKIDIDLKQNELDRKEKNDEEVSKLRDTQRALNTARTTLADARRDALEKSGGKPLSSATGNELNQAKALVRSEFPDTKFEGMDIAAVELANRAKEILRGNRAIPNYAAALRQALAEAKQNGDFQSAEATLLGVTNPFGKGTTQYKGGGKSPETAVPATKDTKFAEGKYYTPTEGPLKGKTLQFKGGKLYPVSNYSAAPIPGAGSDEEED